MNSVVYFEIQSSNPQREIIFYGNVFGWKFYKQEGLLIEYFRIETTGLHGGILKRPTQTPALQMGTNAFVCSMQVENFDVTQLKILQNGGQIALPKFAIAGRCWQGYFTDADNNTFGIFEVDENAA